MWRVIEFQARLNYIYIYMFYFQLYKCQVLPGYVDEYTASRVTDNSVVLKQAEYMYGILVQPIHNDHEPW